MRRTFLLGGTKGGLGEEKFCYALETRLGLREERMGREGRIQKGVNGR